MVLFGFSMLLTQNPFAWPQILIDYVMFLQIGLCTAFIILVSFARLTQIFHILKCKSTGSLALLTCLLVVAGNLGRMFTVFVEIRDDYMFAISICLATILNSTILALFFVYWNNTIKEK